MTFSFRLKSLANSGYRQAERSDDAENEVGSRIVRPIKIKRIFVVVIYGALGLVIAIGIVALVFIIIFLAISDQVGPDTEGFSLYKNTRFEECAARDVDAIQINCTYWLEYTLMNPPEENDLVPELRPYAFGMWNNLAWNNKNDGAIWCNVVTCLSDYQVVPSTPMPKATAPMVLFIWFNTMELAAITFYAWKKVFDFEAHLPEHCPERGIWMWSFTVEAIVSMFWWWIDVFRMNGSPLVAYGISGLNWVMTWRAAQAFNSHPISCALRDRSALRKRLWGLLSIVTVAQLGATIYTIHLDRTQFRWTPFYMFSDAEYTESPGAPCTAAEIRSKDALFFFNHLGDTEFISSGNGFKTTSFGFVAAITILEMITTAWYMISGKRSNAQSRVVLVTMIGFTFRGLFLLILGGLAMFLGTNLSVFYLQHANGEAPFVVDHYCKVINVGLSSWRFFLDAQAENIGVRVARGLLSVGT